MAHVMDKSYLLRTSWINHYFLEIVRSIIPECCFFVGGTVSVSQKYDALPDLVPFALFTKHEKHSWRSFTFSKTFNFTKSNFTKSNNPP